MLERAVSGSNAAEFIARPFASKKKIHSLILQRRKQRQQIKWNDDDNNLVGEMEAVRNGNADVSGQYFQRRKKMATLQFIRVSLSRRAEVVE